MSWINVKTGEFPKQNWGEYDRLVLITYKGATGKMVLPALYQFKDGKFRFLQEQGSELIPKEKVLAWMELPKEFVEEKTEDKA